MRGLSAALLLLAAPALGGPYDARDLAASREAEAARLTALYEETLAFLPEAERRRAADVGLAFPLELGPPVTVLAEPATRRIVLPLASFRFFADMVLLYSWISEAGCPSEAFAAVDSYLYALLAEGREMPPPLAAFAVERERALAASADFAELIRRSEDAVATFLIAHELGHLLLRHRPGLPPEESRAQEAAADAFAMDHFLRAETPPFGLHILFLTSRLVDPDPDAAELSTHPVSTERLLEVGGRMKADAEAYANAFPAAPGLAEDFRRLGAVLTDDLPEFAALWNEPMLRAFYAATITTMAPPDDLAGYCPTP